MRSCGNADPLHSHEVEPLGWLAFHLQAELDCLSHTLLQLVQGPGLGVAATKCRNRSDVESVAITLYDNVELAGHWGQSTPPRGYHGRPDELGQPPY